MNSIPTTDPAFADGFSQADVNSILNKVNLGIFGAHLER